MDKMDSKIELGELSFEELETVTGGATSLIQAFKDGIKQGFIDAGGEVNCTSVSCVWYP